MALDEMRQERIKKLNFLREKGIDPYPARTARTHTISDFLNAHSELESSKSPVTLAGRVTSIREHGGSLFVDIFDGTKKAQCYIRADLLGEEAFDFFSKVVDVSDVIEITGTAFTTKRGMPSLEATRWRMLAKSLRQVPDEWFGIKDEEERYRKRYLDILLSEETAGRIRRRSKFWNSIRTYLIEQGFVEVETPVLETTTGGADARPFSTHHNALDLDVYLRISAGELWQKRLMVAGLPKVFEIGRIFRNEGISAEHLQDYTQMEFYEAFKDYEKGMDMITDMYRRVADDVYGTRTFSIKGFDVDLGATWERYDFNDLLQKEYGLDPRDESLDAASWRKAMDEKKIPIDPEAADSRERLVDIAWKQLRKSIGGPGFLINVPVYMEPLAKRSEKDPRVVERFQVLLGGSENGKGYSELNDPLDQADRFKRQQELREAGDEEAQMMDESYVEALEYGMPPALGFGVSERLFSFLEGISVREGQIFPLLRPKN